MAKKFLSTKNAKVVTSTEENKNTVWSVVGNAAINYIESKPKEEWFTQEEVAEHIIKAGAVGIIAPQKVSEVLSDMFALFLANHILIQNDKGEYQKFTIEDTPFGKGGIVIERKQNGKKNSIEI